MAEHLQKKPRKSDARKTAGAKPVHILLVEDEKAHAELIRRGLLSSGNPYRLSVAATLGEAREVLAADPPELMILDLLLPDGKGEELLPENPEDIGFPVVVMTSYGDETVGANLLHRGVADYLSKSKAVFDDLPHIVERTFQNWKLHQEYRKLERELTANASILQSLINNPIDSIVLLDKEGIILDLNTTLADRLGMSVSDAIGKCAYELIPEPLARTRHLRIDEVFRTGMAARFEDERDGRWYDNFIQPVVDGAGIVTKVIVNARDITENKKAESVLRFLIGNVEDIIWQTTPDLRFTYLGTATQKLTGYSVDEMIGKPLISFLTDQSVMKVKERLQVRKKESKKREKSLAVVVEVEMLKKGGETIWLEVSSKPVISPSGTLVGFQGISREITKRKHAEEALRESEERYRLLVDELPDYIIVHRDGELLYVNTSIAKRLGYLPEELLHTSIFDYVAPECRDTIRKSAEIRRTGTSLPPYEVKIITMDGSIRWVEVRGALITFEGRQASLNVLTDITEKKYTEKALSDNERKFRTLADFTYDWEYWIGPEDDFIYTSPSCERVTGYSQEEFYLDKTLLHRVIHPDDTCIFEKHLDTIKNEPDKKTVEFRLITKDGDTIWIAHNCQPVFGPDGEYLGRRGSNRDITERKRAETALRESEQQLRRFYESGLFGAIYWTVDGKITDANDTFLHMMGYTQDDLLSGRIDWVSMTPPEFRYLDEQSLEELKTTGVNKTGIEKEYFRRDGTRIPIHVAGAMLDEERTRGIALVIDISERKRAEEALRRSEERYRSLFENMLEGVAYCRMVFDQEQHPIDFIYLNVNRSFSRITNEKTVTGKPVSEIFPGIREAFPRLFEVYGRVALTGQPESFDLDFTPIGKWLHISVYSQRKEYFIAIFEDITERKQAEEALRVSEARFRSYFDMPLHGFAITSTEKGWLQVNDRICSILGYPRDEIVSMTWAEMTHPDDLAADEEQFSRLVSGEIEQYSMDKRFIRKDGHVVWTSIVAGCVRKPDGSVDYTIGLMEDITDRKMMEEEVRSLNRVLEQRVVERTEQLNVMLAEKELLLREVHHRVKNNLQIVASLFNLQSRYIVDQKALEAIRESQNRVRAMALVHERLYRSENAASVDMKEYLTYLGGQVFHFYGVKPSQIKLTLTMPEIGLDVDTVIPLGLIVNELLSNSLKHAFPNGRKGTISVSGECGDQEISLVFSDDGVGFPPGFDWKNSPSLGLRLVISLVRQLNGKIELDPSPGMTFRITVPRLQHKKRDETGSLL